MTSALIEKMNNTQILPGSLALWGMGQMGIAIKGPGAIVYIDPCLSDIIREQFGDWWTRAYPAPVEANEVSNATFYFISHEHLDHLDPVTTKAVAEASPNSKFVTTAWCNSILNELGISDDRIINPEALTPTALPDSEIRVTTIPGAHYDKDYSDDKGYRWIGFLIEWNGVAFYHAGDTIIYPGYIDTLKSLPTADVAMVPVNGRDYYREADVGAIGNLLPAEAARLALDLGWDVLIPGHNDMFENNAIPMGEIINAIQAIAPRQKYKYIQPGELFYYVK